MYVKSVKTKKKKKKKKKREKRKKWQNLFLSVKILGTSNIHLIFIRSGALWQNLLGMNSQTLKKWDKQQQQQTFSVSIAGVAQPPVYGVPILNEYPTPEGWWVFFGTLAVISKSK